jgi:hypothetical protein
VFTLFLTTSAVSSLGFDAFSKPSHGNTDTEDSDNNADGGGNTYENRESVDWCHRGSR